MTWGVLFVDINAIREEWAYGPFSSRAAADAYAGRVRNPRSYVQPVVIDLALYRELRLVSP